MTVSKNALVLFCKPPLPGLVKTRLTEERGGNLTNDEAAAFFRCSLLDITELSMIAFDDLEALNAQERSAKAEAPQREYDFFVSTINDEAIQFLKEMYAQDGEWPREIHYIVDKGSSFDKHFDDAFNQIYARGYDNVVAIGGDMPLLPRGHVIDSFCWLDYLAALSSEGYAFVQAPCQQSGVSIVGKSKNTPISAEGVYYNLTGLPALDAYTNVLKTVDIPNVFLSPVSDVDSDEDLAHAISCLNAVAEASLYQTDIFLARRVLEWVDAMGLQVTAPPNDNHDPRQYIDVSA